MKNRNKNYFPINKKQGDIGEAITAEWLVYEGWYLEPYSLMEDKNHHVDRVARHWQQISIIYDVKHDYYVGKTGNIPFEDRSNPGEKAKEPWGTDENVKAEYIIFTDGIQENMEMPQIWIFRLKDLRAYYYKHPTGRRNTYGNCRLFGLQEYAQEYGYWHLDNQWNQQYFGKCQWWLDEDEETKQFLQEQMYLMGWYDDFSNEFDIA